MATLGVRLVGLGTHVVRATYSGDDEDGYQGSQTVTIEVTGDTGVAVSGVGVAYSTFYPYKDNYRDTVAIRGDAPRAGLGHDQDLLCPPDARSDLLSSQIATAPIRSRGTGAPRPGPVLPPASIGWSRPSATSPATRRWSRRIRTSPTSASIGTTGTITKYGDQLSDLDYSTYGWVTNSPRYSRGVNLYGNIYEGYAWAEYSFTLPAATTYGTLTFKVLGKRSPGTALHTSRSGTTRGTVRTGTAGSAGHTDGTSTSVAGAGHVSSKARPTAT